MTRSGCHPDRGVLINALATAGAHRVEAEDALRRCGDRPERVAERLLLHGRVTARRAEEAAARARLASWEAGERPAVPCHELGGA